MDLSRARGVALLVMTALVASVGIVVGGSPAAGAAGRTAPSVSLRQTTAETVRVTGRTATKSPRVRFDRRTASGWRKVVTVRAHRHRYAATLRVAAGTTAKFRVTSNARSRTFTVRMAAAKPPTTYDACGARPRKADGTAWSCTFHDDFDGVTLDRTKWIPQTVFVTGSPEAYACYRDDPANVNVKNGALNLTLLKLDAPEPCQVSGFEPTPYQSGMVSTWHLFSQQYGRFEARIKNTASSVPGLHEAFWMWPDDRYPSTEKWPEAGEIDIAETYSSDPTAVIPFLHYSADKQGFLFGTNTNRCTAYRGQWNTYALEWSAKRIEIFVNGKSCLVNTSGDAAFQKRYIIDLTQSLGGGGDSLVEDTPIPATMQVDYVRVWR